jgi:uncharacterized protein YoxC
MLKVVHQTGLVHRCLKLVRDLYKDPTVQEDVHYKSAPVNQVFDHPVSDLVKHLSLAAHHHLHQEVHQTVHREHQEAQ